MDLREKVEDHIGILEGEIEYYQGRANGSAGYETKREIKFYNKRANEKRAELAKFLETHGDPQTA